MILDRFQPPGEMRCPISLWTVRFTVEVTVSAHDETEALDSATEDIKSIPDNATVSDGEVLDQT